MPAGEEQLLPENTVVLRSYLCILNEFHGPADFLFGPGKILRFEVAEIPGILFHEIIKKESQKNSRVTQARPGIQIGIAVLQQGPGSPARSVLKDMGREATGDIDISVSIQAPAHCSSA